MDSSNNTQQNQGGREDYADKGLDAVEKKFGGAAGQDSGKNRAVNEKIVRLTHKLFRYHYLSSL
jgi:hypothetical protein